MQQTKAKEVSLRLRLSHLHQKIPFERCLFLQRPRTLIFPLSRSNAVHLLRSCDGGDKVIALGGSGEKHEFLIGFPGGRIDHHDRQLTTFLLLNHVGDNIARVVLVVLQSVIASATPVARLRPIIHPFKVIIAIQYTRLLSSHTRTRRRATKRFTPRACLQSLRFTLRHCHGRSSPLADLLSVPLSTSRLFRSTLASIARRGACGGTEIHPVFFSRRLFVASSMLNGSVFTGLPHGKTTLQINHRITESQNHDMFRVRLSSERPCQSTI